MNASITADELHDCIKRLKRNKSPGIDGVLSEMPKDGGDVLRNCLLVIFNLMLTNHFPKQLSVGLITAVYKSGDTANMSNYRGITVGSVIAKLFAMILDHRTAVWAEDEGIKAKGQAGFRKDFRTTDNICVLKSLIDKQEQMHSSLYRCFVNFKKAFDTVPCGLLWQVLETVGIRGPILDCIKSLYSRDSAAVRTQEGISDIFDCLMGVKQGCPLSATLFGLFVDGLEQHLMDTLGHDAPSLSGALVPLLLYADDLTIIYPQHQQGYSGNSMPCNFSASNGSSLSIWPKPRWSLLAPEPDVKLSHSMAMRWSASSHTSTLGLNSTQSKICPMVSPSLVLLPTKQCMP